MLTRLLPDRAGAVAAEFALILGIIGTAVAGAAFHLATTEASAVHGVSDKIANPATADSNATGG